jgi:acyl-coenzyme A synthetase/AMP-(fatty) acid ligase
VAADTADRAPRAKWSREDFRDNCGEWSFISALGHNVLFPLRNGMTGSIMEERASPERILTTIERDRVTLAFDASYPGFFLGYLGDRQRTRETLRDSWFVTSDLARIDDEGYVYILGRLDDCFKCKGVLIVPSELEQVILALGAFQEACVFPVPDKEIGNLIAVAVVPRHTASDALLHQAGLAHALAGSIAPFKIPHIVLAVDELPKNANGKTQCSAVAQLLQTREAT